MVESSVLTGFNRFRVSGASALPRASASIIDASSRRPCVGPASALTATANDGSVSLADVALLQLEHVLVLVERPADVLAQELGHAGLVEPEVAREGPEVVRRVVSVSGVIKVDHAALDALRPGNRLERLHPDVDHDVARRQIHRALPTVAVRWP